MSPLPSPPSLSRRAALACGFGAALALAGCQNPQTTDAPANGSADAATASTGYATGQVYDREIRSVALPVFENRTFYREVEFNLTEALSKEIEARTPYKIAPSGAADTLLSGTILTVKQRPLSRTFGTGTPQEVQVVVTASFEWKDLRSGRIIRKRSRISGSGQYIPRRGVGEPFEIGQLGAIDELSREIVAVMRNDW